MSYKIEDLDKWLMDRQNYPSKKPNLQAEIKLIETHISKVYLTGEFAYKIKKSVDFGFLNFTQLIDRKYFCEEEIRLNSRLSKNIYLNTVAIAFKNGSFNFNGEGKIVEYAVKMHQFDIDKQLDNLLKNKQLKAEYALALASLVASFHNKAAKAETSSAFGKPEQVLAPMIQNFDQILPLVSDKDEIKKLKTIQQWTVEQAKILEPLFLKRKKNGFIKECHGDMHLGNMTFYQDKLQIFDGIEFNDEFKWIDTTSEIAFFCMDLEFQKANEFSISFLNQYLSDSGDYQLLELLTFYKVYRALVRAKIALFTASQMESLSNPCLQQQQLFKDYLQLALDYIKPQKPECFITYGVSGSGKSYISNKIAKEKNLIWIRSDVERKRHFKHLPKAELYSKQIIQDTYEQLLNLTKLILRSRFSLVVDATFLKQQQRANFEGLCTDMKAPFKIINITTDKDVLKKRLFSRKQNNDNISDADAEVMEKQLQDTEELSQVELLKAISIENNG